MFERLRIRDVVESILRFLGGTSIDLAGVCDQPIPG